MNRRSFNSLCLGVLLPYGVYGKQSFQQKKAKRFICLGNSLGVYRDAFWPKAFGENYEVTRTLEPLKNHQQDFTLFSGMTHGAKGGHIGQMAALTTIIPQQASGYADGMQSLDQRIAVEFAEHTRHSSLTLGIQKPGGYRASLAWTRTGTLIPTIYKPQELFTKLFVQPTAEQTKKKRAVYDERASILDGVSQELKLIEKKLGKEDKHKVAEHLESVRNVESRIQKNKSWLSKPLPKVDYTPSNNYEDTKIVMEEMVDMTLLAFQSDLTRVMTLDCDSGYHGLSHHGKQPEKGDELVKIEKAQMAAFARVIAGLKKMDDPLNAGDKMIDNTIVLFVSGMGCGNSHQNDELPILLAGGSFKHGSHIKAENRVGNLFVSILNDLGLSSRYKDYHTPFKGF